MDKNHNLDISKASLAGVIITLGIVYGDIGTSPLYVMRAIVSEAHVLDRDYILGALSCIIWTLTLQTTVKYVIITLRADNKGEGGIFSLFALIRRKSTFAYLFAIIGGGTLLADGIITPSITVVSAIEGLNIVNPNIPIIPVVLVIIFFLFLVQQFGTKFLGKSFGPIMVFWFLVLGLLGLFQISSYPAIIKAFNPYYAFKLLSQYPGGYIILGAVFLCTTGAEALYSDLGHCGIRNIRISWIFVKSTLILNYLGQGAWILTHINELNSETNPFFAIMPPWFIMPGIAIATAAAIIASQALISGSFTLISEGISLHFWPRTLIDHPTNVKGQVYISSINWFLFAACVFVILFFKKSANMEAAYGLSITITMIMTTILLTNYLLLKRVYKPLVYLMFVFYLTIEGSFLIANMHKFMNGGWFTILMAGLLILIMYIWYNGRKIKNKFLVFVKIADYSEILKSLCKETSMPKYATNLVYVTRANKKDEVESKIIYSILNKQPKRADLYWLLHVDITDEPSTFEYEINHVIPGTMIKIDFRLGFKIQPRINLFFRQVLHDLVSNHEIDIISKYESLRKYNIPGDFQFIVIDRIPNYDIDFSPHDKFVLNFYEMLRKLNITEVKSLGLDTSNVMIEQVPLFIKNEYKKKLTRVK